MDRQGFVDLYRLRAAVAALYWARTHIGELMEHVPPGFSRRVDAAVAHLRDVQHDVGGELAASCRALLSPAPDAHGARTIAAIDRLAAITRVDDDCAAALAAIVDDDIEYDPRRPPTLFDSDDDATLDEAAQQ